MNKYTVEMLDNECWYGLCVQDGMQFPIDASSNYAADFTVNYTSNQVCPILISNCGRYIYSDTCFKISAKGGIITIETENVIELICAGSTLKEAYLEASKEHFPPKDGIPPREFFETPQYNTWIELLYDQNQADILNYAEGIINNGYPAGILMIDDAWQKYYGCWEFDPERFPDPKAMTDKLHSMGFKVMLWTCPYISPDSPEFRELLERDLLTKTEAGKPSLHEWWDGYSATIDLSNPVAVLWYDLKLKKLCAQYGIDGFKFDAGDARFYVNDKISLGETSPNVFSELWAKFGLNYKYNEYRACVGCQGYPLVQRLADKYHSWDGRGMASLIPNILAQGIMGYAYTCPDMIGGGEWSFFRGEGLSERLDEELFVRYAQCAALMPMMQFSAAPWRVLSEENAMLCLRAARLHIQYAHYILSLAEQSAKTGEPIVRYMEYEFPKCGYERVTDMFMLGDRILVAPVTEKGKTVREVKLPEGRWAYLGEKIFDGGKTVTVDAPISVLPYFEKR
ncbi:MAG: glycoside hydrolase [Clostridia bacterium]|nr:glycoside hydrolase [Clostridia bacterium]